MNDKATIDTENARRRPNQRAAALRLGDLCALVRTALTRTKLFDRVVRSLFKPTAIPFRTYQDVISSSLLLKPTQTLMLAGIRSAGAGGGGPGR